MNAPVATAESTRTLAIGERNELEVSTVLSRNFQGIPDDGLVELTVFANGYPSVAYCKDIENHIRLLQQAESMRGYCGAYQLVNPTINTDIAYRYELNRWSNAKLGRANDKDILVRTNLFFDIDSVRPKNISATDDQLRQAYEVASNLRGWLVERLGDLPIGFGCSGNGYNCVIAIEPTPISKADDEGIKKFLGLLSRKFGTDAVGIDCSVFNAARLMPAPGTMKRKGRDCPERPHRMTSFACRCSVGPTPRLPLKEVIG